MAKSKNNRKKRVMHEDDELMTKKYSEPILLICKVYQPNASLFFIITDLFSCKRSSEFWPRVKAMETKVMYEDKPMTTKYSEPKTSI